MRTIPLRLFPTVLFLGSTSSFVHAQAPDVATQFEEEAKGEQAAEEKTAWDISAGAILNTGNTESLAGNAGSRFELIRGPHAVGAEALFSYISTVGEDGERDDTRTLNARLRYDYFFTEMDAVFVAGVFRHDPQAGLNLRLQGQLGYLRNFFKEENHRFWGEIGYDITFDDVEYEQEDMATMMVMLVQDTEVVHAARLFVGYENKINEALTFRAGVEGLLDVQDTEDLRINGSAELNSKIADNFQLQVKFLALYDNQPVPGKKKLDTTTQLNLIYTLL